MIDYENYHTSYDVIIPKLLVRLDKNGTDMWCAIDGRHLLRNLVKVQALIQVVEALKHVDKN